MITVQYTFNEKPLVDAKDLAVGAFSKAKDGLAVIGEAVGNKAQVVGRHFQEGFAHHAVNIAFYSSIAANIATASSGSFFSPTAFALNALTHVSLKACASPKVKSELSSEDKKAVSIAGANFTTNVVSQMLGAPNFVKLGLTAYNTLSSQVSVQQHNQIKHDDA